MLVSDGKIPSAQSFEGIVLRKHVSYQSGSCQRPCTFMSRRSQFFCNKKAARFFNQAAVENGIYTAIR